MRRSSIKLARYLALIVATLMFATLFAVSGSAGAARAADLSKFNAGDIISDDTFFNSAAMTADEVQTFLNTMEPSCPASNGEPCLKNYSQATSNRAGDAYCSAYTGRSSETAAQIFANVGVACGVNPQVLVVLVQKEEGLVLSTSPTAGAYNIAAGYACPDSAPCASQYFGFFNQVYSAAHQFQVYTATSSSWNYQPGRSNTILYNPDPTCGSSSVFIANQATANLYIYTPYQPNPAALASGSALGDACSSYGNRNFWSYFTDWFGDPSNSLNSPSFEGGSTTGWGASNGFINRAAYDDPNTAQSGNWFLAVNTPVAGRSLSQDVTRTTNTGEQATGTVWLRSSTTTPFSATVVLWGLGGTTESAQSNVTVGSNWQQVTVKLPVRSSAHSLIRLEIYLNTPNTSLFVDNASLLFSQAPAVQNRLSTASFEGSFANWVPGNGFVNQQIYDDPTTAQDGSWFAASNTPVAGRSFSQTIGIAPAARQQYTFSIWLRSSDPAVPFEGQLALWGLGGTPVVAVTNYTVSSTWTQVSITLDTALSGASQLKAEIYMNTPNTTLWLDNAMVSRNVLQEGTFEDGGFTGWQRSATTMNQAVYSGGGHTGQYYAAINDTTTVDSLRQDVKIIPQSGDTYTAELWVRSATSTPIVGTLALWGLGDTTEVETQDFTATPSWSEVALKLPIAIDDHSSLRFEIYLKTANQTLYFDDASVQ